MKTLMLEEVALKVTDEQVSMEDFISKPFNELIDMERLIYNKDDFV